MQLQTKGGFFFTEGGGGGGGGGACIQAWAYQNLPMYRGVGSRKLGESRGGGGGGI